MREKTPSVNIQRWMLLGTWASVSLVNGLFDHGIFRVFMEIDTKFGKGDSQHRCAPPPEAARARVFAQLLTQSLPTGERGKQSTRSF